MEAKDAKEDTKTPLLVVMMQLHSGLGNLSSGRLKWNWGSNFLFSGEVRTGKLKLLHSVQCPCRHQCPSQLSGSLLSLHLVSMNANWQPSFQVCVLWKAEIIAYRLEKQEI